MQITGTHIHYYFVCHRKLWLFANGLNMEHTSEVVADGKLIHETSYGQRAEKYTEIEIEGVKIDFYDAANKVVHETKRTNAVEMAHEWQLKYYIFKLQQHGVDGVEGILEYPKLKIKKEVVLTEEDIQAFNELLPKAEEIIKQESCPEKIEMKLCKKCAYYDFCWSGEIV
ncbi:CRISPR-associated protein Cas4 [Cytophagaceae bacterium ABcell3]|nr:CRISPR-associated protein Cas4 [Cytophagaceae bacterium ABcell3]